MKISDKALELIVRDVLGGMEELANYQGLRSSTDCLEVIAVETADREMEDTPDASATVLAFPSKPA